MSPIFRITYEFFTAYRAEVLAKYAAKDWFMLSRYCNAALQYCDELAELEPQAREYWEWEKEYFFHIVCLAKANEE